MLRWDVQMRLSSYTVGRLQLGLPHMAAEVLPHSRYVLVVADNLMADPCNMGPA